MKTPPLLGQHRVKVVFLVRNKFISSFKVFVCSFPPQRLRLLVLHRKISNSPSFYLDSITYERTGNMSSPLNNNIQSDDWSVSTIQILTLSVVGKKKSNAEFLICSCFFCVFLLFLFTPPPYPACHILSVNRPICHFSSCTHLHSLQWTP